MAGLMALLAVWRPTVNVRHLAPPRMRYAQYLDPMVHNPVNDDVIRMHHHLPRSGNAASSVYQRTERDIRSSPLDTIPEPLGGCWVVFRNEGDDCIEVIDSARVPNDRTPVSQRRCFARAIVASMRAMASACGTGVAPSAMRASILARNASSYSNSSISACASNSLSTSTSMG